MVCARRNDVNADWRKFMPASVMQWYSYGYCMYLALALHDRFGWPLEIIYVRNSPDEIDIMEEFTHVFVRLPDGRGLDVIGFDGHLDLLSGRESLLSVTREELFEAGLFGDSVFDREYQKANETIDEYVIPHFLKGTIYERFDGRLRAEPPEADSRVPGVQETCFEHA